MVDGDRGVLHTWWWSDGGSQHGEEHVHLGSGIPPWAVARARAEIDFGRADAGLVTPRIPNTWTDSRANGWRRLWGFGGWRLRLDLQSGPGERREVASAHSCWAFAHADLPAPVVGHVLRHRHAAFGVARVVRTRCHLGRHRAAVGQRGTLLIVEAVVGDPFIALDLFGHLVDCHLQLPALVSRVFRLAQLVPDHRG
eukprot:scaffold34748_cov68-Phaeocystis_antarctica.AAC.2